MTDSLFDTCTSCGGMGGQHGTITASGPHGESVERRCPEAELSDPAKKEIGGFRKGARKTSREAAIKQYPRSGTKRLRVLEAFAQAGSRGLTHDELTELLSPDNLGISTWRSRASELEHGGWIEDSGFKRKSRSNEPATVWTLTDRAIGELVARGLTPTISFGSGAGRPA